MHEAFVLGKLHTDLEDRNVIQSAYFLDEDDKTAIDIWIEQNIKTKEIEGNADALNAIYILVLNDLPVATEQQSFTDVSEIYPSSPKKAKVFQFSKKSQASIVPARGREADTESEFEHKVDEEVGRTRQYQGYCWMVMVQHSEPFALALVGKVLANNKDKAIFLAESLDMFGRRFLDIAAAKCRLLLNKSRFLHERYELQSGPPEHKSATSIIVFAQDSFTKTAVVLKFILTKDQFDNEVRSRKRCDFDPKFVVPILASYDGDDSDAAAFREDAILKGFKDYPYCVVLDKADCSLKRLIDQHNICGKEWDEIRKLARQIVAALDHVHSRFYIHGDIKPMNVMLTGNNIRLIDFGASASYTAECVEFAGTEYSSAYIPPEMLYLDPHSDEVIVRSPLRKDNQDDDVEPFGYDLVEANPAFDMWSFGALLYLLATGETLLKATMDDNSSQSELRFVYDWTDSTKEQKLRLVSNKHARNLISLLLCKDPTRRLRAKYVLTHPFLTGKNPTRLQGERAAFDVFLSYRVDSDSDHVELLYTFLTARGMKVWWDKKCLKAGQPWEEGFCEGLINSSNFVCLMSREAINSREKNWQNFTMLTESSRCDNVLLEWALALELESREMITGIFPVFIGDKYSNGNYGDYFPDHCHPHPLPQLTVVSLHDKLQEHLDRQGLGAAYCESTSVKQISEAITAHQGGFIRGDLKTAIESVGQSICDMSEHSLIKSESNNSIYQQSTKLKWKSTVQLVGQLKPEK